MNKRGQVALFVIIGILLVSAVIFVYLFKPQLLGISLGPEEAQKLVTSQVQPVRDFTQDCMYDSARKTLNTMGRQGGFVLPKLDRVMIPSAVMSDAPLISYALFYDRDLGYINNLPSINELKDELIPFLEGSLDFAICIEEYENFEKILDVKVVGELDVDESKVDIGESSGQIVIPYKYPVEISKGEASALIEDYELVIPINLARIRGVGARIINDLSTGKNYMEVIGEEADLEWDEVRANPNSEKIFTSAEAFSEVSSEGSNKAYSEDNLLFNLEYRNPGLVTPYNFYFLVGRP
ncbi:hypothetical protein ACFLZZ_02995 [Nanoarchaeota archaeon]